MSCFQVVKGVVFDMFLVQVLLLMAETHQLIHLNFVFEDIGF